MKYFIATCLLSISILSCKETQEPLPEYGEVFIPYSYIDQNGNTIDASTVENTNYVVDFFFTHCPTICPVMSNNLAKVQEAYSGNENLKLISFSIDPERDTIGRLKWYAEKMGADDNMWHLVRAEKQKIDSTSSIMKVYQEQDASAPGGFNHQGRFLLIDATGMIRGSYDGTLDEDTEELIQDIQQLLD
ncbi:MAG: SCO family protein [Saprospiraceae bacterium]|nr:SCO family protein [Saprospiraceae bacterium]